MFFDEGRFGLQPVVGRQWARRGSKQRVLVLPGYRYFYIYAGVSPLTGETFMLYLPGVDTEIMNVYLFNPVEHLWQWLRRHGCRNRMFSNLDEVMNTITTAFETLSTDERKNLCHCNYLLHYI